jgi:hypothetical protein
MKRCEKRMVTSRRQRSYTHFRDFHPASFAEFACRSMICLVYLCEQTAGVFQPPANMGESRLKPVYE